MTYRDRRDAGRRLVEPVRRALRPGARPLVLGLPRGGVPVAAEIARGLGGDLDILVVRKVPAPGHRELAMGAVASGGVRSSVDVVVRGLGVAPETLEAAFRAAEVELVARERELRGRRPAAVATDREVVLVDDGLATGASMVAAVDAVSGQQPSRTVVASPVGSARAVTDLARRADHVVCPWVPADFRAVGLHYADFTQTTDAEVRTLLGRGPDGGGAAGDQGSPTAPHCF